MKQYRVSLDITQDLAEALTKGIQFVLGGLALGRMIQKERKQKTARRKRKTRKRPLPGII